MLPHYINDCYNSYEGLMSMSPEKLDDLFNMYFRHHLISTEIISATIYSNKIDTSFSRHIEGLWNDITKLLSYDKDANSVKPNKVILSLLKSGVNKNDIHYSGGLFCIKLKNTCWYSDLISSSFWIVPLRKRYSFSHNTLPEASAETIANFILWFDSILDSFSNNYDRIIRLSKKISMDIKKMMMESKLIETTLESISNDSLKPHGISAQFSYKNEIVHCSFTLNKGGSFDLSHAEAESLFQNPEEMLGRMNPRLGDNSLNHLTGFYSCDDSWEIIPENESEYMSRLRDYARIHLSKHGISVIVSSITEDYIHIEAEQRLCLKEIDLPFDKCRELIKDNKKVYSILLNKSLNWDNFINADETTP